VKVALLPLLIALAWLGGSDARACAVCAAGDPTLETIGSEHGFVGRLRGSLDYRIGSIQVDQIELVEMRFEANAAYAFSKDLAVSLTVPALRREIESPDRREITPFSLGDIEGRVRDIIWSSKPGPLRIQFALFAGAKAPTAPIQDDALGRALPADLQPGCSSVVPLAGATYSMGRGMYTFFASISGYGPIPVRSGPHAGDSLRSTAALQFQPTQRFAARLGISTRLDEAGELRAGSTDPSSGGFVGYASSELVLSPIPDLLLTLGAFFPAIQALRGDHREGSIGSVGITYDFF
jgi:hypothetical protein